MKRKIFLLLFTQKNNNLSCKICQDFLENNLELDSSSDKLNFPYIKGRDIIPCKINFDVFIHKHYGYKIL